MGSEPAPLRKLLASGKVKWARSTARTTAAAWGVAELRGRVVELAGRGASAVTTAAVLLVRDAQRIGEPALWVVRPDETFYPPDVAACGVDLDALAVVTVERDVDAWRAAEEALRSGAFGLVVLDRAPSAAMPIAVQVRLGNLARHHDAVLVCIAQGAAPRSSGSLAAVRGEAWWRRIAPGRFECGVRITKDKRADAAGGRRGFREECRGAPGLR